MSEPVKIDLPYVHMDRDKRTGTLRVYFRRRLGAPKIRLRERPGSEAFLAEYQSALRVGDKSDAGVKPRTFRWLMVQYLGSSEFRSLDPRTQRVRRGILESTCIEPVSQGSPETFANFPLTRLSAKALRVLRERKAEFPKRQTLA
jgi:hypothetical protein